MSDAFKERRAELEVAFRAPNHDYYLGEDAEELILRRTRSPRLLHRKERVLGAGAGALGLPPVARQGGGRRQAPGQERQDHRVRVQGRRPAARRCAGSCREGEPQAQGRAGEGLRAQADRLRAAGLIDLIAEIPFHHGALKAKDILGHVYEYFLGEFAIAEGKKGGQYYTPKSIVTTIVEMLQPFQGRVYDPCCGSGGFFVQSEKFARMSPGRSLETPNSSASNASIGFSSVAAWADCIAWCFFMRKRVPPTAKTARIITGEQVKRKPLDIGRHYRLTSCPIPFSQADFIHFHGGRNVLDRQADRLEEHVISPASARPGLPVTISPRSA